MVRCSDHTLYTGITTDITRRLGQHRRHRGAKFFRGRTPEQLAYLESGHTCRTAARREAAIKKLDRAGKLALVLSDKNGLR